MKKTIIVLLILLVGAISYAQMSMNLDTGMGMETASDSGSSADALLLENGDYLLLQTGEYLLLE